MEEKKYIENEIRLLKYKTLPISYVDQICVPFDKIVPVPEITVSGTDGLVKKESEQSKESAFSIW